MRKGKGIDSRRVDWTLRDTDLAKLLGVSRMRVGQVRRELGKPRSEHHRKWGTTLRAERRLAEVADAAKLVPGRKLAPALGVGPVKLRRMLKARGLKHANGPCDQELSPRCALAGATNGPARMA